MPWLGLCQMRHRGTRLPAAVAAAAVLLAIPVMAAAQTAWPQRPVRLIVPFTPGSAGDVAGRLASDGLSKKWGQPVVVENRAGADTSIGVTAFVRQRDDHTLLFTSAATLTLNPLVQDKLAYDPADLAPISSVSATILVIAVNNDVPARTIDALKQHALAHPGKLLWGSGPSMPRYVFAAFLKSNGLDMAYLTYRDGATAQADLGEGRLHIFVTSVQSTSAPVQAGKARLIATLSATRPAMLPDVPTATEQGFPGMTMDGLSGVFGLRDMANDMRERISTDIQAVLQDATVRARIEASGQSVLGSTPAAFAAEIERQRGRVVAFARLLDLKTEK